MEKFKNGAKYFANVSKLLGSINKLTVNIRPKTNNEILLLQMVKSLSLISDTQNDVLRYIVSHDKKTMLSTEADEFVNGQLLPCSQRNTILVFKERIDENYIKVLDLNENTIINININELDE